MTGEEPKMKRFKIKRTKGISYTNKRRLSQENGFILRTGRVQCTFYNQPSQIMAFGITKSESYACAFATGNTLDFQNKAFSLSPRKGREHSIVFFD